MPTYDFECKNCGWFSQFTTVSDRLKAVCPSCHSGACSSFCSISYQVVLVVMVRAPLL